MYSKLYFYFQEFPILCQTCLGDNPYIRMVKCFYYELRHILHTYLLLDFYSLGGKGKSCKKYFIFQTKEKYGKECKICARPFTVFRWCPGARMRFKKTEICQTCSKLKNVCQTCLLDLEYGLPIQVRDAALKIQDDLPRNEVNKEYYIQNLDSQMSKFDATQPSNSALKSKGASDLLLRLARTAPYYKRNRPHVCSFWVKGECRRGEECPYRHEKPTDPDDPLADQNIKDRYARTTVCISLFDPIRFSKDCSFYL